MRRPSTSRTWPASNGSIIPCAAMRRIQRSDLITAFVLVSCPERVSRKNGGARACSPVAGSARTPEPRPGRRGPGRRARCPGVNRGGRCDAATQGIPSNGRRRTVDLRGIIANAQRSNRGLSARPAVARSMTGATCVLRVNAYRLVACSSTTPVAAAVERGPRDLRGNRRAGSAYATRSLRSTPDSEARRPPRSRACRGTGSSGVPAPSPGPVPKTRRRAPAQP